MDVLVSGNERPPLRVGRRALALAVVLLVLLGAQGYLLRQSTSLPDDVRIEVAEGGYVVGTLDTPSLVTFQLRSTGRPVDVRSVDLRAPGLRLTDTAAAGESVGFRRVGDGPAPLPPFTLREGVTLVLSFAASDCSAIDAAPHPVRLELTSGLRRGTLLLRLRDYPDLTGSGGPDTPWQQVLANVLCP